MTSRDFSGLTRLYKRMDAAYDQVAAHYGFCCTGCTDTCCTSLFFHHTFIEKAFLVQGFLQMDIHYQEKIRTRAAEYVNQTFAPGNTGRSLKKMCPLNHRGRCTLYGSRPMICRLHGLPHELHPPGRQRIEGPGCHAGQFDRHPYVPFDRTPFYMEMAELEREFKERHHRTGRIRQTIAQILLNPDT